MRVWRLTTRKYVSVAFSGEGAAREGGRWNREGSAVVYTASSLALAALELFVNLSRRSSPPLAAIPVEVPEKIRMEELAAADLPSNWRGFDAKATQGLGERWLASHGSAILSVPSVVIPQERNYVLNPKHKDFAKLRIGKPEFFEFDSRMWK